MSFLLYLALTLTAGAQASAELEVKVVKGGNVNEQYERDVDQVALASQEKAIAKLSGLLKKYRGTRQESVLLAKLGELQSQTASIQFRIAHGIAHARGGRGVDMTVYRKTMHAAIKTYSELIARFPNYEEISLAFYMRGKSYEEIDDKAKAAMDYVHLVRNWPEATETISAYMSLAEFAIGENLHPKAIDYLKEVEKHPEDPQYPFALYKLAWSYYNLKSIPTALSYAERHITYYNAKIGREAKEVGNEITSDSALRENTLLDITVFYMEGFEQKLAQYQVTEALSYFRKLNDGPALGRMMVRFAKLLRSHGHEQELVNWKDQILLSESTRPEALDVVVVTYEHQLNKKRYPALTETAQDMVRLFKKNPKVEGLPKAQKLILDTAIELQATLVRNKGADGLAALSQNLASLYDSFTKIVDDSDPRIPRVHYNLAETLFEIKDYEQSTLHYRWVVDHGKWDRKDKAAASVQDSSLKAIASRYEVLKAKQFVPADLAAKPFPKGEPKKLEGLISEWIEWIDTHVDKTKDPIDNFAFEAARALYVQGHIEAAVKRLRDLADSRPASKFAIPAASLALDTYLASQQWKESNELASDFLDVREWKITEFAKRLFVVASDCAYKIIEVAYQAKEFKDAIKKSDAFLKTYGASQRLADTLTLAGNSSLSLGDRELANGYFTRLIAEVPNAPGVGNAFLARANLSGEKYEFTNAARDYKAYLSLPAAVTKLDEKQANGIRRKTLALAWLSNDTNELKSTVSTKVICPDANEALAKDCDRYRGLLELARQTRTPEGIVTQDAFEKSRKGFSDNKAVWASVALEGTKDLPFRDRLLMIHQIAAGWEDLDPLVRFTLVPIILASIPRAFQLNRVAMREVAPLKADEKWIRARIDKIKEMESAATDVMKRLPWSRIRAVTLSETAGLYLDLSKGLASLSIPKGLPESERADYEDMIRKITIPFEEKGQEMRQKAYEIASTFAIEDEAFHAVADPYFQDNPSSAAKLKPYRIPPKPEVISTALLEQLDPSGDWDDVNRGRAKESEPVLSLKIRWASAVKNHRLPQMAFFLQEAKEKKLLAVGPQAAMRAISLASAGAQGEALIELSENAKELVENARPAVFRFLVSYYFSSFARAKTETLVKQLRGVDESSALDVQAGLQWGDQKKPPVADGQAPGLPTPKKP